MILLIKGRVLALSGLTGLSAHDDFTCQGESAGD